MSNKTIKELVKRENFFKPKAYNPDEWVEKFKEYIEERTWLKWKKIEAVKSGDRAGKLIKIPTRLPLTIESFCVFAGVTRQTFLNYESKEGYDEYFEVTSRMRGIIESDQIDGALIGAFQQNIIARMQGLIDKREDVNNTPKKVTVEVIDKSDGE